MNKALMAVGALASMSAMMASYDNNANMRSGNTCNKRHGGKHVVKRRNASKIAKQSRKRNRK